MNCENIKLFAALIASNAIFLVRRLENLSTFSVSGYPSVALWLRLVKRQFTLQIAKDNAQIAKDNAMIEQMQAMAKKLIGL